MFELELLKLVAMAEEAALDELAAFGCIEFEEEVPALEWAEDAAIEAVWEIARETRPLVVLW